MIRGRDRWSRVILTFRGLFSNSIDDLPSASLKKKNKTGFIADAQIAPPKQTWTKSGNKIIDDSLRLNKRNNSFRGESPLQRPLAANTSGLQIGMQDKQPSQQERIG